MFGKKKRKNQNPKNGPENKKKGADFGIEPLEKRVLLSASWVDADTGESQDGPTNGDDIFTGADLLSSVDKYVNDVDGKDGNDVLYGGDGADKLKGGSGLDYLVGDAGDDKLEGGKDNDILYGGEGSDELKGGSGLDYLLGDAGDDELKGQKGDDNLKGGDGNDELDGGSGLDYLAGEAGDDDIDAGKGDDVIVYTVGDGSDVVDGDKGDDTLIIRGVSGTDAHVLIEDGDTYSSRTGEDVKDDRVVVSINGEKAIEAKKIEELKFFKANPGDSIEISGSLSDTSLDADDIDTVDAFSAAAIQAQNPTHHWLATEGGFHDSVGSAHGEYHGSSTDNGAGGVVFDGNDHVVIEHANDMLVDQGTVHLSFNADSVSGTQGLFSKDSTHYDDGGHITVWVKNGEVEVRMQSTDQSYTLRSDVDLVAGQEYDVDISFGDDGLKLFVNGELADSDSYTGGLGTSSGGSGNAEPIVLGANAWQSGDEAANNLKDYFSGTISDVAIFGEQLDADEISAIHEVSVEDGSSEAPDSLELTGGSVAEDAEPGAVVGTASAGDSYTGGALSYSLTDDAAGRFEIDQSTGEITVADGASFDHETADVHNITVAVSGGSGPSLVANEDFQSGVEGWADSSGDTYDTTTDLVGGDTVLRIGGTGGEQGVSKAFSTDSDKDYTIVEVDLVKLDSWDEGWRGQNDSMVVFVDGEPAFTFQPQGAIDNGNGLDSGSGTNGNISWTVTSSGSDTNLHGPDGAHWGDRVYSVRMEIEGGRDSMELGFGTTLTQGMGDESLGINNLTIASSDDPTADVSDAGAGGAGFTVEQEFAITVGDVNEGPSDLSFTGGSVDENAVAGTQVASVSVSDVDDGDSHSFELTDDADGRFAIDADGNITVAEGASLDHESAGSHEVTVRVTDSGGATYEESVTITVGDVNEAPTSIDLDGSSVPEGVAGAVIGQLGVVDPDADDDAGYAVSDSRFEVTPDGVLKLRDGVSLDHETTSSVDIEIIGSDSAGNTIDGVFTINVQDVNEGPSDLSFTGGTVTENAAGGTFVTSASVTDVDEGDTHSFELTDDAGGRFEIDSDGNITVADGADLNFEASESHEVTVRVTDEAGESYEESVTITVGDVNEGPSDLSFTGGSVDENAAAGTQVASVSVTDVDAGDSHSFELTDDADGRFAIDADGNITVAEGASLDHESAGAHEVTVRVTDSGGATYEESVTITVGDVNEGPSDLSFTGGSVDENAAAGTPVASVSVSDVDDGDTHSFELTEDAGGRFAIDADGNITVAEGASLDHESAGAHEVTVRVTDSGGATYEESVTITVGDVNEGPSDLSFTGGSVDENAAAGTQVASVSVTDVDDGDTHSFELTEDAGGRFAIDADGNITVAEGASLDHESAGAHEVTVRVTDSGGATYEESVTITVGDVNEGPSDLSFTGGSVDENAAAGTQVASVSVTDVDDGDTHSFELTEDAGGRFAIDADGNITVAEGASLDHESAGEHEVTVRVTDSGGATYEESVTITVGDVNEGPSDLSFTGGSVDENAAAGTPVASVSVSDVDDGDTHSFELTEDAGGRFAIDADGNITVAEGADLDHESAGAHEVTVRVTDSGGATYEESVTITVGDVNEGPSDLSFTGGSVDENAVAGTQVASVSVSDVDDGDSHSFELTDDADGRFAIDADGNITVAEGADLDHESAGAHEVTVRVTDSGGATYEESVTIMVGDVNEGPSDLSFTGGSVDENAAAGTQVASVSVSDVDDGDSHSFELTDDADGRFAIDADGNITVAEGASLDHESAGEHEVTVRVTDSGGATYEESVTITVGDVNEGPSDLSFTGGSVDENAAAGTQVASVSVSDVDDGDSHSFELTDDAGGRFAIDADGNITVAEGADLDHESAGTHEVTVRVTDSGGATYEESVTIMVGDVNEGPSDLSFTGGSVDENAAAGTPVASVSVSDVDDGDTHSFELTEDAGGRFAIDADGNITVAEGASLDHESAGAHEVTVRVTDSGGATYEESVTITVGDVNEGPSDLSFTGGSVDENAAAGTQVASVSVTDVDAGDSHSFELTDDADGRFAIDADGNITVAEGADLDHESAGAHEVTVRVTDSGGATYEESVTITVGDVNEGPSDLSFTGGSVDENAVAGTQVASVSVSDVDDGDSHSFELTDDADGRFAIDADGNITVAEGASLDHESAGTHEVTVRVTDSGGATYEESVTITVGDVNEGPSDLSFTGGSVDENAVAGTQVASVSVSDVDDGDTHSFELTEDAGGRFAIDADGNITVAEGASLDHESAGEHEVTVRVTDSGGATYEESVTITVGDVNEGPSDLSFTGGSVDENAVAGTQVASVSVSDVDDGDTHSFELTEDAGGRFAIDADGNITVAEGASLDHESAGEHEVTVRVTDSGGATYEESVTIMVGDVNEGPSDLSFTGGSVDENAAAGTPVASVSVTDVDAGDSHSFELTDDADGRFAIDADGNITVAEGASLDHESAGEHEVTVRVTDSGGATYEESVTITVGDVNEGPISVEVSEASVEENALPGTLVARVGVADPDAGETFTYALIDDADGRFTINAEGGIVVADGADIDYEFDDTHSVTVLVTDSAGNSIEQTVLIEVINVSEPEPEFENEAPTQGEGSEGRARGSEPAVYKASERDDSDAGEDAEPTAASEPQNDRDASLGLDVTQSDQTLKWVAEEISEITEIARTVEAADIPLPDNAETWGEASFEDAFVPDSSGSVLDPVSGNPDQEQDADRAASDGFLSKFWVLLRAGLGSTNRVDDAGSSGGSADAKTGHFRGRRK